MDWSNDYLKPLLLGGPCCVGTPLGEELLTKAQELPLEPVFDEILPELLKTYAKWLPRRIQAFDADFGLFTTSLYELCSTIHPQILFSFFLSFIPKTNTLPRYRAIIGPLTAPPI